MTWFKIRWMLLLIMAFSWGVQAYQNPITLPGAEGDGVADPCAIKWMGKYYLYCTRPWGGSGVQVWESTDLVDWTYKGLCSTDSAVDIAWAPDVFYYNGTFYLYVSQGDPGNKHKILSADNPLGPFTFVTNHDDVNSIDGQVFMDDDGSLYFSYSGTGGIRYRTMSSPTSIDGTEHQLTSCVINDIGTWTEASQIFKKDGLYYMHYSGNDYKTNYQVHSAKGTSVADLTAQPNNPILIQQSGNYQNVGHNYVIVGPDMKTHYTIYHAMDEIPVDSTYRRLMVDSLGFDGSGNCYANGPTFSTQPDPAGPTWQDGFERGSIGADWTNEDGGSWGVWEPGKLMWCDNKGSSAWARQVSATSTANDYVAEFNAKLMGTGTLGYAKYGVFTSYAGDNMFAVWIDAPNNLITTWAKENGVDKGWINSAALPAGWDHAKWHNLRVEKEGSTFKVFYDNMLKITRTVNIPGGKVGMILEDCHADFGWCGFSNLGATDLHPGMIGNSQIINHAKTPEAFLSVTAATGNGSVSYQWQQANDPAGSWSDIAGATGATYAFPSQGGATTLYARRKATDSSSLVYFSNVATLEVRNAVAQGTVAYWRFENGSDGMAHAGDQDDFYTDSTGNGNHMSSWWDGARPTATSVRPYTTIPQSGVANALAIDFAGGNKDLGTFGGKMVESYIFSQGWTIEVAFRLNSLGWQVMVGKDGRRGDLGGSFGDEAPFWLKVRGDNGLLQLLAIDDDDHPHDVESSTALEVGKWYSVAATYDNAEMKLYLKGETDVDYVFQGSVAFTDGVGLGGFTENWSIGRGMYAGGVTDFVDGKIDEVRISNYPMAYHELLAHTPLNPGTIGNSQMVYEDEDPAPFTSLSPAAGIGTVSYLWQYKIESGGSWVDLIDETGTTYDPPRMYQWFPTDTQLFVRRMAMETYNPTNYSNEASVQVKKLVFANWAEKNGLVAPDDAFDADPDKDGLNNLSEYALGGDPNVADASGVLPLNEVNEAGVVEYIYRRRLDRANLGLTYGLNTSTNLLGVWSDDGISHETSYGPIDETFESVTNLVPFAGELGFIQLKVTEE